MAKPIVAVVKLQVPAGQATPAPPVGTALGPHGVNIMEFVKQFNAKTQSAAGIEKGSPTSNRQKVGTVTRAQVKKIAEIKMPDLNATSLESAMKMIAGTARSMGLEVVE